MRKAFLLVIIIFLSIQKGQSQNLFEEYIKVKQVFDSATRGTSFVLTGGEYVFPNINKNGTFFFPADTLVVGNICYDGYQYNGIPLQWDIYNNYVLTLAESGSSKIILRNDLIDSFLVGGHRIIKMKEDRAKNLYNSDFYEVLYRGFISVFARRKSVPNQENEENKVVYKFRTRDKYYLQKDGIFYRVSNRIDVLNVFSNSRSDINKIIRKEGLNWNKQFELCLITAASSINEPK